MAAEFLGAGWQFPVATEARPPLSIARARENDSVRQAVWIILSTAPGERVMRPDFGCGIYDLVFAPNDASTAGRVAQEVRQALTIWEPRIDLLDVEASAHPTNPAALLIAIEYRVRTTNTRFNMVYPFYLDGGRA
jgi:phage baseplate assembly protein W